MAKGKEVSSFAEFVAELLRPMGPVTVRRMFSGAGLFCDGLMFALIIGDVLHLKADDSNRARFEAEGMGPFVYTAKGRSIAVNHWRVPERLLDEPDELVDWSREALAVARGKAAVRTAKTRQSRPAQAPKKSAKSAAKGRDGAGRRQQPAGGGRSRTRSKRHAR